MFYNIFLYKISGSFNFRKNYKENCCNKFFKAAAIIALLCFLSPIFSYADNDNVVLSYRTFVEIEEGKLVHEETISIQVNNKEGDWIAEIEIPYGEGDKIEISEANIINSENKIVRTLKKKDINTVSDVSRDVFYENNFIKQFELKWHEYPYVIKYTYKKTTGISVYPVRWYPVLYKSTPVVNAELEVKISDDFPVLMNFPDSILYKESKQEGHLIYHWKSSYTKQIKPERYGVNIVERLPSVSIIPKSFFFGKEGSFESWASYGLWHYTIIEGLDELPESEKAIVDNLLGGTDDTKEKIKILYQYLQDHTRYINVAIDEGGLVPYPASYVCTNKYGDCKALTIYMKALLRYAGIPSFYTLVYAGENPVHIDTSFPSQQFNHVILCVPDKGDTVWLENTSKYNPCGYLGTFTQNRYGLLVNETGGTLVKTPTLSLEEVLESNNYHFELDLEGNGILTFLKKIRGSEFENYKYYNELLKEKDKVLRFRKDFPVSMLENPEIQFLQEDRNAAQMEISGTASLRDQFKKLGQSIAVIPFPVFIPPPQSNSEKEHFIRINFPVHIKDSLVYQITSADNYQIKLPDDIEIASAFGLMNIYFSVAAENIIIRRQFQLFAGEYPVTQYQEFNSFLNLLKREQQKTVIILNPQ